MLDIYFNYVNTFWACCFSCLILTGTSTKDLIFTLQQVVPAWVCHLVQTTAVWLSSLDIVVMKKGKSSPGKLQFLPFLDSHPTYMYKTQSTMYEWETSLKMSQQVIQKLDTFPLMLVTFFHKMSRLRQKLRRERYIKPDKQINLCKLNATIFETNIARQDRHQYLKKKKKNECTLYT